MITAELRKRIYLFLSVFSFLFSVSCFAEENPSSSELITKAWAAQGREEFDQVLQWTQQCVDLYKEQADKQHSALKDYPAKDQAPLSDVAAAYFIRPRPLCARRS